MSESNEDPRSQIRPKDQSNSKAWGFFIAALLFSFLAYLLNSSVVTIISNVVFVVALVYVTIYYARRGKLGYLSIFFGIFGIVLFFAKHPFIGAAFFIFGLALALVDCIAKRRWGVLVAVALLIGLPALFVGGFFWRAYTGMKRDSAAPRTALAQPRIEEGSVVPQPIPAVRPNETPVPLGQDPESEPEVITILGETTPPIPHTFGAAAPPTATENPPDTSVKPDKVWLDEPRKLFHAKGCPEIPVSAQSAFVTFAQWKRLTPHSCYIPDRTMSGGPKTAVSTQKTFGHERSPGQKRTDIPSASKLGVRPD